MTAFCLSNFFTQFTRDLCMAEGKHWNVDTVFVDLFDASANNTVLECIVRNTPIIINKLDAVVEYLGDGYPLYYNELSEVPNLINGENILRAHNYLKQMDKTPFKISTFLNKLYDIVYEHFL